MQQAASNKVVAGSRRAHSKGRRSNVVAARLAAARQGVLEAARSLWVGLAQNRFLSFCYDFTAEGCTFFLTI